MLSWFAAAAKLAMGAGAQGGLDPVWQAIVRGESEGEPPEVSDAGLPALHRMLVSATVACVDTTEDAAHVALAPYMLSHLGSHLGSAGLETLGGDPPAALYDAARGADLPHSLKGLGAALGDLSRIATHARSSGVDLEPAILMGLLDAAYHARRPARGTRYRRLPASGPHAGIPVTIRGTPLGASSSVLIAIHGRGAAADRITRDLEAHLDTTEGLAVLAPQALDNAWYPKGFTVPVSDNQPFFDGALAMVDACWWEARRAGVSPDRIVLAGFSQGGCLLLSWARLRDFSPGALLAFSAAELDVGGDYRNLSGSQVTVSKSEGDPWIPQEVFERTARSIRHSVEDAEIRMEPGETHAVYEADGRALARAVEAARRRA